MEEEERSRGMMTINVDKAGELDWKLIEHFEQKEFDDPDSPGSWIFMDARAVIMMDWLRKNTEWEIVTHNKFGVRGCVCVQKVGHSPKSFHYVENGAHAVDFHFNTDASARDQACAVVKSGFRGIGIYQDVWKWGGKLLPIAFHVDRRKNFQIWTLRDGEYIYFLR